MNTQTFGALVQTLRKQKAMTQEQLANEINVTSKAVSRWERGIGLPDISMIKPLADALGTGVLELMVASPQAGDIVPECRGCREHKNYSQCSDSRERQRYL